MPEMQCALCSRPDCHLASIPVMSDAVAMVEGRIALLRMEDANIRQRLTGLQAELVELVEKLPTDRKTTWLARGGSFI